MKRRWFVVAAALSSMLLLSSVQPLHAQDSMGMGGMAKTTTLWIDERTGEVFIRPGHGRVPMTIGASPEQIQQQIQQQTQDQVRAAVAESEAQQRADNQKLQQQVAQMQPAWHSYIDNFQNKFRIGTLAYLDYGYYTHTAFGPQWLENLNPPGVGNNGFNSFDVNRVYINTYFTPTKDWNFRFTPELYRANGTATADKVGNSTAVSSNLDGNLNVRMKYAYVQNTSLWDQIPMLKGGNVTFGAQPNPFIPWEEDLYEFRYVNLTPWGYLGLSSSQVGLQFNGPVKLLGGETNYIDYGLGVYNNANFHTTEESDTKQIMAKATVYPFGADWRFEGLGLTGFYNYGWGNTTPDSVDANTNLKVSSSHFSRIAAVLHYAAETWNVASEFDYGNNAFTTGNLYSGSEPADAGGFPTGPAIGNTAGIHFAGNTCTTSKPCYSVFNTYGPQYAVYQAYLNNGRAREVGFDLFGHYLIPGTKLTAFGMFQWFLPNDNVNEDPLDFQRFIAGLSYQVNEFVRIAADSQNLLFYHNQFGVPVSYAEQFNYIPGSTLNGRLLPKASNFVIPYMVPRDMHTIFLNLEFSY